MIIVIIALVTLNIMMGLAFYWQITHNIKTARAMRILWDGVDHLVSVLDGKLRDVNGVDSSQLKHALDTMNFYTKKADKTLTKVEKYASIK